MKIIITEEQKKKLFIPRKLSGEDSRWFDWNKEQPIVDGLRINQYNINTGNKEGIWEAYHFNGKLWSKGSYKNGKEEGYWEYYHDNGKLWSKGSYKNGEKDGIWEEYWSNGQLDYKGSFKNNLRDGYWEEYWSNGQLWFKGSYKNGEKDGIWERYFGNGQLDYKGSYKNGKLIKKLTENINEDKKKLFIPRKLSGEDSRWAQWNKDQPIVDGLRINQYDINTGKKQGIWEEYHYNGQLWFKGSYKNNLRDGYWEEYWSNGQLWFKGSYKNGEKDGIWEKYYDNGQLMFKGSYKNGEKDGIWEEYYSDGQLEYKGSFKNGDRDGYWEEYWSNGKLRYKGSYKNGDRDGIWEWYYSNGQLDYKGSYKNGELIKKLPLKESETPKKKLFIPRKLSGEDSRWADWNKEQSIKNGEPINQYDINTGKKEGIWEKYYDNGQLMYKGSYKNGDRDGIWEEYYSDGQLWYKGSYKNGEKDGIWEEYWSNGQLDYKGSYKNGELIKKLPLTESEEQKKKLFIPRNIDDRKIEAEKIKQKYISEIKEIIEEEGSISMGELGGDSIMYGYATEYGDEIALIEGFYSDYVEVVVYGGYKYNTEETSFRAKYEELDLDIIMKIRKLLETYLNNIIPNNR
jgi:antitoxin component YwqK of YwqJK toxin-antitoxin module